MSHRFVRVRVVTLCSVLFGAVHPIAAQSAQEPPGVLFAREYVRVLRDSGAAGVIPMTVEKTRALKGYAPNMDALRQDLASAQTSITLDRWSAVPSKGDVPSMTLVVFKVNGVARPVDLSLYIEDVAGRPMLNTIMTRPQAIKEERTPRLRLR